jgi:hypothetical protein
MKKRTWRRWSQTVSTVKKSTASIWSACLADELRPGALAAAWRGLQTVAPEDVADCAVRGAVAELEEFALDPAIAPPRVLLGHADDQLLTVGVLAGLVAGWPASVECPLPADQAAVPAQQRLRADQEGPPGRTGQETTEGGEDQPVAVPEARSTELALKDAELMAEGENLDLESGLAKRSSRERTME